MLLELMFVVAIILILFCLYWGAGLGPADPKQFAACNKNLQFMHTALVTYAHDNNEKFPFVKGAETSDAPLSLLVPKYTSQTTSFICPSSGDKALREGEPFAKKRISYAYVMGLTTAADPTQLLASDEQIDTKAKAAGARIFSTTNQPPGNNHGGYGGNILMVDGSVETIKTKIPGALTLTNATLLNPKPKR